MRKELLDKIRILELMITNYSLSGEIILDIKKDIEYLYDLEHRRTLYLRYKKLKKIYNENNFKNRNICC